MDPASPEAPELARRIAPQLANIIERTRRNNLLRDLAYSLSHDLRTPLTANLLNLCLAASGSCGPLPPNYLEALQHGIESSQALLDLADDLLRLSLYETGQIRTPVNGVEINGQIGKVARSLAPLFTEAGVDLVLPPKRGYSGSRPRRAGASFYSPFGQRHSPQPPGQRCRGKH